MVETATTSLWVEPSDCTCHMGRDLPLSLVYLLR